MIANIPSLQDIGAIAGVVALIGVAFTWIQTRQGGHQLMLELMSHFHERYNALYPTLNDLPDELNAYDDLSSTQKIAISSYLNMCAEQSYWRRRRLIADDVWSVWFAGIQEKCANKAVRLAWTNAHCKERYYEGFAELISPFMLPASCKTDSPSKLN